MAKKKMLALEISLLEDIKPATQYSLYLEDIEDDLEFIEFEFRDLKYEQLKYNINVNIYQHISNLTKIFNEEVVNNLKKTYNNIKKNLDLVVAIDRFLTDYNEIREQQINIMLDRFYLFRDLNIEANAVMIRSVNEIRNEALYRFEWIENQNKFWKNAFKYSYSILLGSMVLEGLWRWYNHESIPVTDGTEIIQEILQDVQPVMAFNNAFTLPSLFSSTTQLKSVGNIALMSLAGLLYFFKKIK